MSLIERGKYLTSERTRIFRVGNALQVQRNRRDCGKGECYSSIGIFPIRNHLVGKPTFQSFT